MILTLLHHFALFFDNRSSTFACESWSWMNKQSSIHVLCKLTNIITRLFIFVFQGLCISVVKRYSFLAHHFRGCVTSWVIFIIIIIIYTIKKPLYFWNHFEQTFKDLELIMPFLMYFPTSIYHELFKFNFFSKLYPLSLKLNFFWLVI